MGLIYMRTSPSGKSYIGQTTKTEEERWKEHCYEAESRKINYNSKLNKAIRKYGGNTFSVTILEECNDKDLNNREQYWIDYYDTYINGYNSTLGGEGSLKYSDTEILSLWKQGLNQREIAENLNYDRTALNKRLKLLISQEERTLRHDSTAKNSLSQIEKDKILFYWNAGKNIKEISSLTLHDKKVISSILKKNGISPEDILSRGKEKKGKRRRIAQYSTNGELIHIFNSMKEAVEALKIDNITIGRIIQGRSKKYKDLILKDIKEGENNNELF